MERSNTAGPGPLPSDAIRVLTVCGDRPSPAVELLRCSTRHQFEVDHVQTCGEALPRIAEGRFNACVLSAVVDGAMGLMGELRDLRSPVRVVVIDRERSPKTEAETLRLGAVDYLVVDERLLGDQRPLYERLLSAQGGYRKVFASDGIVVAKRMR